MRCQLTSGLSHPVWQGAEFAANHAAAAGFDVRSPLVSVTAGAWPRLHVEASARLLDAPVATTADVDFAAKAADVKFAGALAPGLLEPVGRRLKRDLGRFLQVPTPVEVAGEARFGAGWKFQGVDGRAEARGLLIHGVRLDDARARIEFDGHRLFAPEAFVRFGSNFARGSYEQDDSDRRYLFLLEGQLQPLDISPWFNTKWWPDFFGHFRFPAAPPAANLDWHGRWPTDHESAIFLVVDSGASAYNGAAFDHAFARLFIRPNVITDGLEVQADRGAGHARGDLPPRRPRAPPGPGPRLLARLRLGDPGAGPEGRRPGGAVRVRPGADGEAAGPLGPAGQTRSRPRPGPRDHSRDRPGGADPGAAPGGEFKRRPPLP